jgi:uncharacterized ParB-like nuclease family protein
MSIPLNTALQTTTAQTIKAHSTTAVTSPTADAWTDCGNLVAVADECSGDMLTLNADGKSIYALKAGIYEFGGCVHYQNNSGGDKEPLVASRILINNTTEAKCSQRATKMTQKDDGEDVLSYNGTVSLDEGEYVRLQYYTSDDSIDFTSNAVFAAQVTWTIWLRFIGIKGA